LGALTGSSPINVSGADSGYFELLAGAVRSIRDKPEGAGMALGVLDVGLTADQRRWLEGQGALVVAPGWDLDFPGRGETPQYRQAQYGRPFLPKYFPGHDLYMWLDADAWVQDWAAVELFFRAAETGNLAIVPELDRAYRNFFRAWEEFHSVIKAGYAAAFDTATAERLVRHPLLNNGAFALRGDALHWQAWADTLGTSLQQSRNELIDMTTLNHVVYVQGLPAHFLPAWCNWICHHAPPRRDPVSGELTEPYLPHQRLGIVHLTLWMKDRRDLAYGGGALSGGAPIIAR
jgi:hypothetical protein